MHHVDDTIGTVMLSAYNEGKRIELKSIQEARNILKYHAKVWLQNKVTRRTRHRINTCHLKNQEVLVDRYYDNILIMTYSAGVLNLTISGFHVDTVVLLLHTLLINMNMIFPIPLQQECVKNILRT